MTTTTPIIQCTANCDSVRLQQNTVYNAKASSFVLFNASLSTSVATVSFHTFYKSRNEWGCFHCSGLTAIQMQQFNTAIFTDASLYAAGSGALLFWSNLFGNNNGTFDTTKTTNGTLTNYDFNVYQSYSGTTKATNDTRKYQLVWLYYRSMSFTETIFYSIFFFFLSNCVLSFSVWTGQGISDLANNGGYTLVR